MPEEEFIISLGIECTAHTFGVGIIDSNGKEYSDVKSSYVPSFGEGIHPREAARHHSNQASTLIKEALKEAAIKPTDLKLISFSRGPGMGPCLRTGAVIARTLSGFYNIPLVGVNHVVSHIEIGKMLTKAKAPVILMVSGGTTQISSHVDDYYTIFGETLDISIGNCFDKFSREVGIHDPNNPWPGPVFDKVAAKGKEYFELPYSVKGMSVSFSGLLTAALRLVKEEGVSIENAAFSLQETALSMLTEIAERAIAHTRAPELLIVGGFARNQRFQSMLQEICKDWKMKMLVCPYKYASDNGTMIAWGGILQYKGAGALKTEESQVLPDWRSDAVKIVW
ncbi:MAG: tRNA (adenosine(37)-N6)-threonylcarbamoyltransferase complex transferase subunit TsaD [Candidatus Heimdallarchaeota archaeon]|nr:tRNA (adenosine(37)-N6)-threonylcarbamoyltransferase complex transferase subunit TsaD [Candidatus Heimdallarchaeota archaeon]MBY8993650.1 tRNA (adenosine(37)-N6)-threonylcarbamoyltransferase complex transferase subunit TsaD [Candidatus Heimdallarchaeota archaeon]